VRFRAGGVLFAIERPEGLTGPERSALDRLDRAPDDGAEEPFLVQLEAEPPWASDDPGLFPRWEPAVQRWADGCLLVSHRSFTAEIHPMEGRARVHRREERAYPLEAVIRTAMMARLPLVGGLPLHAAGVVAHGRGIAFFGPSGAGKSTLARTSPHPVLSDELVALGPGGDPPSLVRSGFWGEGGEQGRPAGAPLAALVELDQGPTFALTRLGPLEAMRGFTASLPVPLAAPLWSRALAVAAAAVTRVPVYRMAWSPAEPPWEMLAQTLEDAPSLDCPA
jgi:hypothetical protein